LIFAVALAMAADPLLVATPILVALALASIWRTLNWPAVMALANPLVLEFALGMATARLFMNGRLALKPWVAVMALALGAAYLCFGPRPDYWSRPVLWGGAAALVLASALALEPFVTGRMARYLSLLGEASYALYLVHGFVLQLAGVAAGRLHLHGPALETAFIAVSLTVSIAAAVVVHLYVERPLTKSLRKLAKDRNRRGRLIVEPAPL